MSNFFDFNKSFGPVDEESRINSTNDTSDDEEAILKETFAKEHSYSPS